MQAAEPDSRLFEDAVPPSFQLAWRSRADDSEGLNHMSDHVDFMKAPDVKVQLRSLGKRMPVRAQKKDVESLEALSDTKGNRSCVTVIGQAYEPGSFE